MCWNCERVKEPWELEAEARAEKNAKIKAVFIWVAAIAWTLLQAYWCYVSSAPMTHGSILISLFFAIVMDVVEAFSVGLFLFLA